MGREGRGKLCLGGVREGRGGKVRVIGRVMLNL